jgi:tetratricopeptide (TPR) repeat protein
MASCATMFAQLSLPIAHSNVQPFDPGSRASRVNIKSILVRFLRGTDSTSVDTAPQGRADQARDMHRRGDLEGAFRLYEDLLKEQPDNAEVCYRFGNLLKDQGVLNRAMDMYNRAIALKQKYSHALCNRAVVLGLLNQPADALHSYDLAIEADPSDSIAYCNRAMLLLGLGQKDSALSSFEAALKLDPANFNALFGRGAILQERKQWADSLATYQRAVAFNSTDAPAHYNLAVVATELKRWDYALENYELAIQLNPKFSSAYVKRAEILRELKQYPASLSSYNQAISLDPADANSFSNRGVLRQSMGDIKAALADYDQAIALNPASAEAWLNRGTALKELDDFTNALASFDRALELLPNYDAVYVNRGVTLQDLGLIREAVASYEAAIALKPGLPEAHYNLARAALTLGDYEAGWREYEWRWRAKGGSIFREKRDFTQPLWLGREAIAGKTILLYAEQGLGDCLQFARYCEMVAQLGAQVILEAPAPLVALLGTLPGVARVIAYGNPLPHVDFQCPLMSLPLALGITLETIPSSEGYLRSDADKVSVWRERLGVRIKPRVGLTWSGTQVPDTARMRHFFALSQLIPYLPDTFDYFCLQTDIVAADQQALENSKVVQFRGLLRDFADTAALCSCMDLVISVDTSVAHLACAIGKTTWVLLAYAADWRWLLDRDDSPWYRSARLFRQGSQNEWQDVFERVAEALQMYKVGTPAKH